MKRGKSLFEVKQAEPSGSNYRLVYLQCSSCGGVAGVTEYFNSGVEIGKVLKKIDKLEGEVEHMAAWSGELHRNSADR